MRKTPAIPAVICPKCNHPAVRTSTQFGIRDDCTTCNLGSWAGKPLVTYETLSMRKSAHDVFDQIWGKYQIYSRTRAYKLLAKRLNMKNCHIADMNIETAKQTVAIANEIINEFLEGNLQSTNPFANALRIHPLINQRDNNYA